MLSDGEKLYLYSLALPEIPNPLPDVADVGRDDVREFGRWRTYARQLRQAGSPSAIEEVTVDFLWELVGPRDLVAFLELERTSGKYRCVRSKSARAQGATRSNELLELGPHINSSATRASGIGEVGVSPFIERLVRGAGCDDLDGRYLALGVDACGFSGALLYSLRSRQGPSEYEREQLCMIADLLSLALSNAFFASGCGADRVRASRLAPPLAAAGRRAQTGLRTAAP